MITIRFATVADGQAIGKVQLDSWRTMFPDSGIDADAYLAEFSYEERAEDWLELLADLGTDQIVLVAESEAKEVIGFALGRIDPDPKAEYRSELVSIHILPAYRHQGIGRQLILTLRTEFERRGIDTFWLWTLKGNPARRIYEKLGGILIGEEKKMIGKNEVGIEIEEVAYGWKTPLDPATLGL